MEPLAYRMKPTTLDDFYGQEEIVGKDKLLYRLIKADKLTSAIFWGPPGCGKTSLARIIANTTKNKFASINATQAGVSNIKKVVEEAGEAVIEAVDGNRDRFIYETSDLAYHLLVLLESMGCTVEDIERELALRHR